MHPDLALGASLCLLVKVLSQKIPQVHPHMYIFQSETCEFLIVLCHDINEPVCVSELPSLWCVVVDSVPVCVMLAV